MITAHEMARDIVAREGGFVENPNDPGGATKWGVTIHTLRNLNMDLDGDGDVDVDDVKSLTKDDAVKIFIDRYFKKPKIDLLPPRVQPLVFDFYVNSGNHAITTLQRLLIKMGESVKVDGALGPNTAAAVDRCMGGRSKFFIDAYAIERRNFFYRIADRNPKLRVFARRRDGGKGGWIKRAEEFMSDKYHLTDTEHAARIRKWA